MVDAAAYDWDQLVDDTAGLRTALAKCQSVNVNRDDLRASAKGLVQRYFRHVRPELRSLECEVEDVEALDGDLQSLLKLAQGRNRKQSYLATLRKIQRTQTKLSNQRLVAVGEKGKAKAESNVIVFTETEKAVLYRQPDCGPLCGPGQLRSSEDCPLKEAEPPWYNGAGHGHQTGQGTGLREEVIQMNNPTFLGIAAAVVLATNSHAGPNVLGSSEGSRPEGGIR